MKPRTERYMTGTGQSIRVHTIFHCKSKHCAIHYPSQHRMAHFPTHWREDRYLMERICPHGIGHPDPDHLAFVDPSGEKMEGVHGCDGCCRDS